MTSVDGIIRARNMLNAAIDGDYDVAVRTAHLSLMSLASLIALCLTYHDLRESVEFRQLLGVYHHSTPIAMYIDQLFENVGESKEDVSKPI